ncbi:MAG: hypothetical protein V4671_33150 [Armatimonadota bacterium]
MTQKKQVKRSKVFDDALRLMRSRDAALSEDGFGALQQIAPNYADELL